jgi:SulP family sulfate permease
MFPIVHGLKLDNLRGDVFGGLTAAVVALPLALAFGVASGAGPLAGLYGAIFVGLFAALFGGTPSQISGPTGPMTVVMAAVITQYADQPALAFTVVVAGGLLQIAFGLLRLGRYIRLVPYPVVSGFMTGIGCIILILEVAPLFGHGNPGGGIPGAIANWPAVFSAPGLQALGIGAVSLAIVLATPRAVGRIIPPPLLALLVGTALALTVFPSAPRIGDIPTGLPQPSLPALDPSLAWGMAKSALVLALLGSIDSLLTSLVADSMTRTRHDSDRELIGQGIGNAVAGLFGGLPGAGATMRTVVNIRTGGQTPLSGALHAITLLVIVLGAGAFAANIPHAVLAGILIKVGIDIIDWSYLRRAPFAPRKGVVLMLIVLGLTVFVDLIMAVGVGVVLSSLIFVKRFADLQDAEFRAARHDVSARLPETERDLLERLKDDVLLFRLRGPLSFGAAKDMVDHLLGGEPYRVLILDMSEVPMIDSSAAFAIEEVVERARSLERDVYLVGMPFPVGRFLNRMGVLRALGPDHRFVRRVSALKQAARALGVDTTSPVPVA